MWIDKYIGLPWVQGGREFPSFDCWGLVRDVYRSQLNINLPVHPYDTKDINKVASAILGDVRKSWVPIDEPEHLCVVTMSTSKVPHHVGVFLALDGGLVLHSGEHQNACCQTVKQLHQTQGFSSIKFVKHGSLCNS